MMSLVVSLLERCLQKLAQNTKQSLKIAEILQKNLTNKILKTMAIGLSLRLHDTTRIFPITIYNKYIFLISGFAVELADVPREPHAFTPEHQYGLPRRSLRSHAWRHHQQVWFISWVDCRDALSTLRTILAGRTFSHVLY